LLTNYKRTFLLFKIKMVIQFHLVKGFKRERAFVYQGTVESQKLVVSFSLLGHLQWGDHGSGIEKIF